MHELADADRAGVAVTADADRNELPVRQHRARANRWHAAVDGIEAVRSAEKVRGALARTADARQLDHPAGVDTHLEEGIDDALGNRVVSAPCAQRRFAAAIRHDFQSDPV